MSNYFPDISLLVTHYNRSASLENLLQSFIKVGCSFGAIVVSDDGSNDVHTNKLRELQATYNFNLVPAIKNGGLGRNLNKGDDAVTTPYTLYVQEDFEATEKFPQALQDAFDMMSEDRSLDMAKFYAYYSHPYLTDFKKGFSKITIPALATDYTKIYAYTDHPHLRRSDFFEKFGRYPEGLKGDVTEYKMCISFLQNKGQAIFYNDFTGLFIQKNSEAEPSTMSRTAWKQKNSFFISLLRTFYRQVKYNFDIAFASPLLKLKK
ncbi:glycosyltransferase family 2 protein [Niabella hibiscisoli]|uniref:glycosyltransferase family 2 protein n=1 Tax=Niabella hibiscisoli TaxID=1825928 RepID=UPI001F0FA2FF|nr:glycosyltransferase [Niabella hibiscisoli]MCH5720426.1 glycosyltransferase [Niabella hibiscisoli]